MKKFFAEYAIIWRLDPILGFLSLIYPLVQSAIPFAAIVYGARITDLLTQTPSAAYGEIMQQVYWMAGLTMGLTLIYAFAKNLFESRARNMGMRFSDRIAQKGLSLPYSVLQSQECKELLQRAHDAANMFGGVEGFITALARVWGSLTMLVYAVILFSTLFSAEAFDPSRAAGGGAYAFLLSPWSNLVVIAALLLSCALSFGGSFGIQKLLLRSMTDMETANRRAGVIINIVEDVERGKDIRLYGLRRSIENVSADNNSIFTRMMSNIVKRTAPSVFMSVLGPALLALASYALFGLKAWYGIISIGAIVAAAGAVTNLSASLNGIVDGITYLRACVIGMGFFMDFLAYGSEDDSGVDIATLKEPYVFAFEHVSFRYPNSSEWALKDVSFAINPNSKTAVVGRNGAGKSTIVKLLTRFYVPEEGRITVNGVDIRRFSFGGYQKLNAAVFQDFTVFDYTARENVTGSDHPDETQMNRDLAIAGVYDRIARLPAKTDTYCNTGLSEAGVLFSGGEAQKIAIARALYKDAPLITLDEPTSALDPLAEQEIYDSFGKLVNGRTSVYISHRMSSTRFCERILVIDKGHIVEDGSHETLMAQKNGLYRRMFEAQAQYYR